MRQVPPVLLNILNERYSAKKREPNEPMVAGTMDPDIERGQFNINDPAIQRSLSPESELFKQYVPFFPSETIPSPQNVLSAPYVKGAPSWVNEPYTGPEFLNVAKNVDPQGRLISPGPLKTRFAPVSSEISQLKFYDAPDFLKNIKPSEFVDQEKITPGETVKPFSPIETGVPEQKPSLKMSFPQKIQDIGNVASDITKGIGKFGLAAYAGSYPFEMTYDPVYSYTKEYVPEPLARTAAVGAGTAAAIPASELAVVGIPETARTIARARELGLLGRTSLGLRLGAAGTGTAIKSAAGSAPYIAAGIILAPYVWEADKEDAAKRAEMLQRFETKKENEAAIRKNLGLQQEESWLDRLKDNFAKAMILGGDRGIMAAGRQ